MIRKHCVFRGRVQGVGFRYFTLLTAKRYTVTGYVKNRYDSAVEVEVQGQAAELAKLISELEQTAPGHVDRVEQTEVPLRTAESGFKIRY